MFGSQKTELTRKYVWNSFDLITWSFQNRLLLAYSTDPTTTNSTASIATTEHSGKQLPIPPEVAQQRIGHRERHQEEADVLKPLGEVRRVQHLQRIEDHHRG